MKKECKILSIIIPAYNSQDYLKRCINSIPLEVFNDIDIIVVNDGSKDNTLAVAKTLKKEHPKTIQIINKKNGGHGSTINEAIKIAKGKYIRVLDSDDWLNYDLVQEYIKKLKYANEDLILTNYSYNYIKENKKELVNVFEAYKKIKIISDILDKNISENDFVSFLSIHSCTIKTEKFKKILKGGLLEKTFYEDQEYIARIILATETVKVLDLDLYQYMIGRNEQSMAPIKLFQRRKDHEKVIRRLVSIYEECEDDKKREILSRRIREIFKTHYWIYFYHSGLTRAERYEFKELKAKLAQRLPDISKNITWQFKMRLLIGRLKNTMLK